MAALRRDVASELSAKWSSTTIRSLDWHSVRFFSMYRQPSVILTRELLAASSVRWADLRLRVSIRNHTPNDPTTTK